MYLSERKIEKRCRDFIRRNTDCKVHKATIDDGFVLYALLPKDEDPKTYNFAFARWYDLDGLNNYCGELAEEAAKR